MSLKQKRMKNIVERFQKYVATYSDQHGYLDYEDITFINDMLYGLGIALEPEKYQFAQVFTKFKEFLIQDGYVNAGTTANPNSCKQSA